MCGSVIIATTFFAKPFVVVEIQSQSDASVAVGAFFHYVGLLTVLVSFYAVLDSSSVVSDG